MKEHALDYLSRTLLHDMDECGKPHGSYLRQAEADTYRAVEARFGGFDFDHKQISPAEVELAAILLWGGLGGCYTQQHPFGQYWIDFWFPGSKLAVEVQSKQWHHSLSEDWERAEWIRQNGVSMVLHIPAGQILDQPSHILAVIEQGIEAARMRGVYERE